MSSLTGQDLGQYHILEQLGEGGMATVYKAFDTRLEREVAVKVIRRGAFPGDQLEHILKRFKREARALARLVHPNIVGVIDYGEHNGASYLVMPYISGGTLKQRLGKPLPWQEAARLLLPIARALQYAHGRGIVHRDVKPSNILMPLAGEPMLTDFGIAKILESGDAKTATGTGFGVGLGTPEYMAPEQWVGKASPQSDIYSLGVVFYELVTGRKPYAADTPAAILLKQSNEPLPRPRSFIPELPDEVENTIFKALAKEVRDRYQTMDQFVEALENCARVEGEPAKRRQARISLYGPVAVAIVVTLLVVSLIVWKAIGNRKIAASTAAPVPSVSVIPATSMPRTATVTSTQTAVQTPTPTFSPEEQEYIDHPEHLSAFIDNKTPGLDVDILFYVNAGQLFSDGTVRLNQLVQAHDYVFAVDGITGLQAGQAVVFIPPLGSGLPNIPKDTRYSGFFSTGMPAPAIPGIYTIASGDKTWTFDLVSVPDRMLLAKPSVQIKDGVVEAFNIQWIFADTGNPVSDVALSRLINQYEIQISGSGEPCNNYDQGSDRLFNSGYQSGRTTTVTLNCSGLKFDQITGFGIAYSGYNRGSVILSYHR